MSGRLPAVALASGLLFGLGLACAGLTHPAVVLGFLDVTGRWDPTLGVAMLAATAVNAVFVAAATRRRRPIAAARFDLPASTRIDPRLLVGAAVFGTGWGLVGVCPGPALTSVATGDASVLGFVIAMTTGLVVVEWVARVRDSIGARAVCAPTASRAVRDA